MGLNIKEIINFKLEGAQDSFIYYLFIIYSSLGRLGGWWFCLLGQTCLKASWSRGEILLWNYSQCAQHWSTLGWQMKTKIFDLKPSTVMQKHLPGSLHIYLCNIRLGIPRSSWRPWNFIMLSCFYVIVLNIAILSVQCPEIRQSAAPASASPMGWFVNVSLLLGDTYYETQQVWKLVDNRLTTSSSVDIFLFRYS